MLSKTERAYPNGKTCDKVESIFNTCILPGEVRKKLVSDIVDLFKSSLPEPCLNWIVIKCIQQDVADEFAITSFKLQ